MVLEKHSVNPSCGTTKPRVSIGMPVYNGERFLKDAINSLLAQSFEDFELILLDNASTDRTEEICRTYADRDNRIRYVRNKQNIGLARNFNRAFQLSCGEYFKWASADDLCHHDLVAECLGILDSDSSVVLAYPKTRFIDERGELLNLKDAGWDMRSDDPLERMRYVVFSGHRVNVFYGLVRSKDLALTRLFPNYLEGDCRLIGELCLRGKFFETPEYLFFRRIHPNASSQNVDPEWQHHFFRSRRGWLEMPFWHICLDHSRTILSSELSSRHKIACLAMVLNRMFLQKRQLLNELHLTAKYYVKHVFSCL